MIHIERIVNRIFQSNTYIISIDDSNDVWLVDVGDTERVIDILPQESRVCGVFLTHTHFDHIYGINILYDRFPDMVVYVAEEGFEALFSAKKNLSLYHESPLVYKGGNVIGLKNGSEIDLYHDIRLQAFSTSGHSQDSMSFMIDNVYLFTGDAYIPSAPVISKLPGGNKEKAAISRQLLIDLSHGKMLLPGHGDIRM